MDTTQRIDLLNILKALADEQRLTMIGLMNEREMTVGELAEKLQLTEPTISHHVSKMRTAGLLHLRMAGNQRFYRTNEKRIAKFKAYAAEIEQLPTEPEAVTSDESWIDALDWDAADKKVLRDFTINKRLKRLPLKESKWQVVLRWLATQFQPDRNYTEKEVNTILSDVHSDYATLRRYLVEYGFMRRERGGSRYWLAPENDAPEA